MIFEGLENLDLEITLSSTDLVFFCGRAGEYNVSVGKGAGRVCQGDNWVVSNLGGNLWSFWMGKYMSCTFTSLSNWLLMSSISALFPLHVM